ncbi:MAG: hypothetical protein GY765_40620 [bacterium]|nr:hypothetical protein [bacterium]
MKRMQLMVLMVFGLIGSLLAGQNAIPKGMAALMPAEGELEGWRQSPGPRYAASEDLFTLINGGAEIFSEYGFAEAVSVDYKSTGGKSISMEIYRMKSTDAAYGIYTFKTGSEGRKVKAGCAALLEDYYLHCLAGNYLIVVTGFDTTKETIDGLKAIARAVAGKIDGQCLKPELIKVLPEKYAGRLKADGVTYLKGGLGLLNMCKFADAELFRVREGVIADYDNFRLLLFKYADDSQCAERLEKMKTHFKGTTVAGKEKTAFLAQGVKDGPLVVEGRGKYIVMVKGLAEQDAGGVADSVKK